MATRKRDRFFALFGALLFLITSSTLVIAIIVSNIQSRNQNNAVQSTSNSSTNQETNKLQGTQLSGFTPISNVTALQATDLKTGNGTAAKDGDTLVVDYTGAVAATGTIFQSSLDSGQTFSFKLGAGQVITGWDKGLVGAQPGSEVRLLIPADQAYGANPPAGSGIPANAPLVFDITVHAVTTN